MAKVIAHLCMDCPGAEEKTKELKSLGIEVSHGFCPTHGFKRNTQEDNPDPVEVKLNIPANLAKQIAAQIPESSNIDDVISKLLIEGLERRREKRP